MAYDPGAIDAALAAAVGDDHVLIAELRAAFREGAAEAVDALDAATDAPAWEAAARRLRGLAASFGAVRLMAQAEDAARRPHDPVMIGRLRRALARL